MLELLEPAHRTKRSTKTPHLSLTNQFGGVGWSADPPRVGGSALRQRQGRHLLQRNPLVLRISSCVRDQPTCQVWSRPTNYWGWLVTADRCSHCRVYKEKELIKIHQRASRPSASCPASDRGHRQIDFRDVMGHCHVQQATESRPGLCRHAATWRERSPRATRGLG